MRQYTPLSHFNGNLIYQDRLRTKRVESSECICVVRSFLYNQGSAFKISAGRLLKDSPALTVLVEDR